MNDLSILYVDDDADDRELMLLALRQAMPAARLWSADSAHVAQNACATRQVDCLILDYRMPDMDGLRLAQAIRPSFPYMPIILCTGFGDEELAAQALTGGVTDYLPKGKVNTQSLRRTIDHAVRTMDQARTIDEQRKEIENFAYALAHDFKQPIRQIRTFTALIEKSLEGREGQYHGQHLTYLNDAARRLGHLVDVMSQYTLLSKPPELGRVELNSVLFDLRMSLEAYLAERNGRLEFCFLPAVIGNESLLTQVFQNLIVNGLKYNTSSTPMVSISYESTLDGCVIRIHDNGIGIEPRFIREIFKPLVRLHSSAEFEGAGLGLALARKAVVAQRGALWCKSTPGEGSDFFVRLPIASELKQTVAGA